MQIPGSYPTGTPSGSVTDTRLPLMLVWSIVTVPSCALIPPVLACESLTDAGYRLVRLAVLPSTTLSCTVSVPPLST
jgi:hypothetical protein